MPPTKQRATTLQEKFGFIDEDLKTPLHDAMLMWINQQAEDLIREYFPIPLAWPDEIITRVQLQAEQTARNHFSNTQWAGLGEPPARKHEIGRKIMERPIVTSKDFAVGFADMEVSVRLPEKLVYSYSPFPNPQERDLPHWEIEWRNEILIFEAKTSIKSVGELIRQIRLYQQYQKAHCIVVSPDDRFADILRGQGIEFVKFED